MGCLGTRMRLSAWSWVSIDMVSSLALPCCGFTLNISQLPEDVSHLRARSALDHAFFSIS